MSQSIARPNELRDEGESANRSALRRESLSISDRIGALHHAERLLELYPADRHGYVLKAQALVADDRLAEALDTLRLALPGREDDRKLLSFMRNVALGLHGPSEAMEYALRFAELSPDDLKNELFLIDCMIQTGDLDGALDRADALVSKHPAAPQAFMLKAQALAAQGHSAEALHTLRDVTRRSASTSSS